jgi:hypothetical protein
MRASGSAEVSTENQEALLSQLYCLRNAPGPAIEDWPPLKALNPVLPNLIQNLQKLNQKVN